MTVIVIKGRESVKRKLRALNPTINNAVASEMLKIITEMDSEIKIGISSGGRSGKTYKRRVGGKSKKGAIAIFHQASAPGELPKTDRGGLVSGFFFNVERTAGRILGKLMNKSKYAPALEFKLTSRGGRPFMRPLYNRWARPATIRLTNAMNIAIKSMGTK